MPLLSILILFIWVFFVSLAKGLSILSIQKYQFCVVNFVFWMRTLIHWQLKWLLIEKNLQLHFLFLSVSLIVLFLSFALLLSSFVFCLFVCISKAFICCVICFDSFLFFFYVTSIGILCLDTLCVSGGGLPCGLHKLSFSYNNILSW